MLRKNHCSSRPPSDSTATIAPFWTNSRSAAAMTSLLDSRTAVQLDRALHEEGGARVDRGTGMALHHEMWHAVVGEEQRHRQAHQAATDDQYRNLFMPHA